MVDRYYGHWEKKNRDQDVRMIVGGDFNIRIGGEGNLVEADGSIGEKEFRVSKDKVVSNGWNKLTDFCSKEGWSILNGNLHGDDEGEYCYVRNPKILVILYQQASYGACRISLSFGQCPKALCLTRIREIEETIRRTYSYFATAGRRSKRCAYSRPTL